ncbi:hypothetical protein ACFL5G_02240 [Candidatus Margulisiibacteriota bacterium]
MYKKIINTDPGKNDWKKKDLSLINRIIDLVNEDELCAVSQGHDISRQNVKEAFANIIHLLDSDYTSLIFNKDNFKDEFISSHLLRFCSRVSRAVRLIGLCGPKNVIDYELRMIEASMLLLFKAEKVLELKSTDIDEVEKKLDEFKILVKYPEIKKRLLLFVIKNIARGSNFKQYDFEELSTVAKNDEDSTKELSGIFIELLNKMNPKDMEDLLVFSEELFRHIIECIENYPGKKVLCINNEQFLAELIKRLPEFIEDHLRVLIIHDVNDILYFWSLLDSFVRYLPTRNVIKNMAGIITDQNMINPLRWIVNNIPKHKNARDCRRSVGNLINMINVHELLEVHGPALLESIEVRETYIGDELTEEEIEEANIKLQKEKKIVENNKPRYVLSLLSQLLGYLDTSQINEGGETALAFVGFAETFGNIADVIFELDLGPIESYLKEVYAEKGLKHCIGCKELIKINKLLVQEAFKFFFKDIQMPAKIKQALKKAYLEKDSIFSRDKFLITILKYYFFQKDRGKELVIELLEILLKNGPKKENNFSTQEYKFYHTQLPKEDLKTKFVGIYQDILAHLGVKDINDVQNITVKGTLQDIKSTLLLGKEVPLEKLEKWTGLFQKKELMKDFPNVQEVLVNFEQIQKVQEKQNVKGAIRIPMIMEISSDMIDILNSGIEPLRTCQRITTETGVNKNGEPIQRAIDPRFYLARVRKEDGGEIVGRAILEQIPTEDGKQVFLLERRYLTSISDKDFVGAVFRAIFDDIDILIPANGAEYLPGHKKIALELSQLSEGVYRDSFYAGQKVTGVKTDLNSDAKALLKPMFPGIK